MSGKEKTILPFDYKRYAEPSPTPVTYTDGSDALANKLSQVISFHNVRNEQEVFFKAYITAYNESYTPNFKSNEVFGRTDPIYQYSNTKRDITLAFQVPASTPSEAYENLGRVQKLIQMLYPTYADVNNALSLSEAPVVRLKVMNLLRSQKNYEHDSGEGKSTTELFREYTSTATPGNGMLGVINSCTVNHNLENLQAGAYNKLTTVPQDEDTGAAAVTRAEPNTILPKLIDINISFSPMHERTLGYLNSDEESDVQSDLNESFYSFPYGVNLQTPTQSPELPPGVEKSVELQREAEEKRQAASKAQQTEDKQVARYLKTLDKAASARDGGLRQKMLSNRAKRQKGRLTDHQIGVAEDIQELYKDLDTAARADEQAFADIGEFL
jgi:hypothetical protein